MTEVAFEVLVLQRRLALVDEMLGKAVSVIEGPSCRRLLGGAERNLAEYLEAVRKVARDGSAVGGAPTRLRVVK